MTKFTFDSRDYSKGRLVLAVISDYVSRHPAITFNELKLLFPARLQGGSMGVFLSVEEADAIAERVGRRTHHFLREEELIDLDDSTIAVIAHWGLSNTRTFIEHAAGLGYRITEE